MKFLFAALLLFSTAASAEEKWLRLSTPTFEVFTNAGAGMARQVLHRFEEMRQVLLATTHAHEWSGHRVRIFVFRDESEFAAYKNSRRSSVAGLYRSGPDRDCIVMRNTGEEIYRIVFHEYVHLVLHHSGIELPLWFNEGTAELFSTVEMTNSEIRVGERIPQHILTLRNITMIDLPTLMHVDENSNEYNEENKAGIFYAESWAFVHMLNMSEKYASGLPRFLQLMLMGTPQTAALEQVYGRSSEEVYRDLQSYVNGNVFVTQSFQAGASEPIGKIEAKPLTWSEAELALADLLIDLGRPQDAERKLKKLARNKPNSFRVEEAQGDTALAQHRHTDALKHYERALHLGSNNARIYFEKAALVREMGGDVKEVIDDLQRAIDIDPANSQARDLLASVKFTAKKTESSPARVAARSGPETPKGWQNLVGDHRIEGKLVQVDCLGKAARFYVLVATQKIAFHVDDPSKVVLMNAPGSAVEFACGTMQPRDVVVEYIAKPDTVLKSAGEITSIQFR